MSAPTLEHTLADALPEMAVDAHGAPCEAPELVVLNEPLADELGLDVAWLRSDDGVAWLTGAGGGHAMAYAGHQFGTFVPLLGDGRALLLGDLTDAHGVRREIQLKGSGRTSFSRPGSDGRGAIGPMLREYLVSEFMHAVGIPTTRSLAVVATGETVERQFGPVPGGIVARVARSHLRVGTVQLAALNAGDLVQRVVLAAGFPAADELLRTVMERQLRLVAAWMRVGFVHGVMNTDNTALSGETIDYGPCAFTETFRGNAVYSSIDRGGRYAFGNQPNIIAWNLARLADALLAISDEATLTSILGGIQETWDSQWTTLLQGLSTTGDITTYNSSHPWPLTDGTGRTHDHGPLFLPRNHMLDDAITKAEKNRDYSSYFELLAAVTDPFNPDAGPEWMAQPEGEREYVTFCGT
ncbi:protein adenylyltransferase SelO family protein [Corynebacterium aquatimens]|uniref:Protein nucleotidyltransferase YdiU n=1 Tax=Corynebacterium aquatimens TaxID=1190508 RepID=A0A931GRE2_9CORY|nr:protein adenylyltransferase SelO family protein [Corynebacterium aquatimens]MBG6121858.1 uncharacterized protein YdiU (UPF0061 family) [Corynebacterium aquatimens]WJY65604.1 hypothetical protein CAQUA_04455 [Corynebacterium aquatimens]